MSLWRKEGRSVLWISVFFPCRSEGEQREQNKKLPQKNKLQRVARFALCRDLSPAPQIKLMDCCLHQFKSSSSCNQNCCLHLSTLQSAFTSGIITSTWALKVCRVFYSFAKMCKRARTKSIIPFFGSMIRLNTCHSKIKALLTKEEYCAVL